MANKVRCAFFPITDRTLPIIRYINKYSKCYQIVTLITFQDLGIINKDGSSADNGSALNLPVFGIDEFEMDSWDLLIIADEQSLTTMKTEDEEQIYIFLRKALEHRKSIICARELLDKYVLKCKQIADINHVQFNYLAKKSYRISSNNKGSLARLNAFYAVFGNLIGDASTISVFTHCMEQLSKEFRVSAVSTDVNSELYGAHSVYHIIHSNLTESERIYELNGFFKRIEAEEKPNITLLYIVEPIVEYSISITNGFGVIPFLFSKAVPTNYFECGIPFDFCNPQFIGNLSMGLERQNGYEVDAIHNSNVVVDYTVIDELESMSVAYVPYTMVRGTAAHNLDDMQTLVIDCADNNQIEQLVSDIKEHYIVFKDYQTIP